MKYLTIVFTLVILTGCGSSNGGNRSEVDGATLMSLNYSLQASLLLDDARFVSASGSILIPDHLDRLAGANETSRAVLTIGDAQCYYVSSASDSSMTLQDCTGGIPYSHLINVSEGDLVNLHIEFGNVIAGVNLLEHS